MQTDEEVVYLDLQGDQSDHCCAEGQWRRQVRAQVEKGKPVGYTRGTDHTHHLTNTHGNSQRTLEKMTCSSPDVLSYQIDTDVDKRAEVWEERNDRLPLEGETDALNQAAGRLPLHLSPGEHGTKQSTIVRNGNRTRDETLTNQ